MTNSISPKHTVLYADDDPDDLSLVTEAFEQYAKNVEVIAVADGGQALSLLEKFAAKAEFPCLIILDVNMPVIDGKEVLMKIRRMDGYEDIPVVLFTTSSSHVDKHFAEKYKAGFITKPLNLQQMELITEEFIAHCSEDIRKNISRKFQ